MHRNICYNKDGDNIGAQLLLPHDMSDSNMSPLGWSCSTAALLTEEVECSFWSVLLPGVGSYVTERWRLDWKTGSL